MRAWTLPGRSCFLVAPRLTSPRLRRKFGAAGVVVDTMRETLLSGRFDLRMAQYLSFWPATRASQGLRVFVSQTGGGIRKEFASGRRNIPFSLGRQQIADGQWKSSARYSRRTMRKRGGCPLVDPEPRQRQRIGSGTLMEAVRP